MNYDGDFNIQVICPVTKSTKRFPAIYGHVNGLCVPKLLHTSPDMECHSYEQCKTCLANVEKFLLDNHDMDCNIPIDPLK